ncbi:DoxX family protein [Klebsiella pneumoniae subsp. pneumoniae]|uniref:DoxX family protein n=1 Tax=Klebsiella pneumoniae TaxID=573 RepID=UPI0021B1F137|nr:DoxX family protein [Klebsiella pneumoniae]MCT6793353.1 DoxX family protein [Klebsiella pneumoniae subsp. pneumoniae]
MVKDLYANLNSRLYNIDVAALILRLTLGGLLLFHGWHKVHSGIGFILSMLSEHGVPSFVGYGIYLGEVVAPILIILGICCRLSAITVIGTMLVAWLLADIGNTFHLNDVGAWAIEDLMFYVMMSVVLLFLGCGKYSVMGNPDWR